MEENHRRMDDGRGPRGPREEMPHRMSPEERRQLRDQIREANRDWRGRHMRGPRGPRGER
jgi:hypothetical protein